MTDTDTLIKEHPFTLSVLDADLELLQAKLDTVRFPDELDAAGWQYGAPLADIKRLVARWQDGFDWRKSEADINTLPMFTRNVDVEGFGMLNIHYVHQRSEVYNAIPLLFLHGWPGHFLEVRRMLPILTTGSSDHPSFHVVAVSLPGYGFSEAPTKPGFTGPQYCEVFHQLMVSLGYDEYVCQGGDWGHVLAMWMADLYGHRHVKAWHTNCPMTNPGFLAILSHPRVLMNMLTLPFNVKMKNIIEVTKKHFAQGSGYMIQQATNPQTLGYGLADSPVGLLAWIYEKLKTWSDDYPWTDDEVLEWVSIYWFSRAGPTATLRIYYELSNRNTQDPFRDIRYSSVPLGTSYFPREVAHLPQSWAPLLGNLVFLSVHEKGGHFAAYEQPEKLVGDLRSMFGTHGPAFGVVPGKNGYA